MTGHDRSPGRRQATGTGGMARVERVAAGVQDEHDGVNLTVRSLGRRSVLGVTPSRAGAGPLDLPSPRSNTRYRLA
ncbi:hypothetical protein ABZ260_49170, partial [Streptosporangium sp. NPDC006013]|uniref:hypothetical protein n=1 Tax=Streptosporangium sp. NPDC006013 TaxID=3155596 RepID=UPI0033A8CE67